MDARLDPAKFAGLVEGCVFRSHVSQCDTMKRFAHPSSFQTCREE